jgi:hypothetical protein
MSNILTENQVIEHLKVFLQSRCQYECNCRTDYQHGIDICATKGHEKILIEAKGAKPNKYIDDPYSKVFTLNQVKHHLAVAILQALHMKRNNPKAIIGIAHPNTLLIRKNVEPIIPYLQILSIKHYWVSSDGDIEIV